MNYETASDFELNKRLAEKLGVHWCLEPKPPQNGSDSWLYSETGGHHEMVSLPDYCNSWSDMGPIIVDLNISIMHNIAAYHASSLVYFHNESGRAFEVFKFDSKIGDVSTRAALRAAVIVAIQVLEARA